MPSVNSAVLFKTGTKAQYDAATINENYLYFTSDTHQLFVGSNEFTKSFGGTLNAEPSTATAGEIGKLYAYNGNVYVCASYDGTDYTWTRIANINDYIGTVTSVEAGSGLSGGTITSTGTISHAVPDGAGATTSRVSGNQNPGLGDSFVIQGFTSDAFGHVTTPSTYSVSLPGVYNATGTATTLASAATFSAVTGIEAATESGNKVLKATTTTYTLPASEYSFASTSAGKITVTPAGGTAYDVTINGWSDLATKNDISHVFIYKGSKATYAELPSTGNTVGDVWHVEATNSEYVWCEDPANAGQYHWEELGSAVDLSNYALSDDVISRVTSATAGNIAVFSADGQVSDSGVTPASLGATVVSEPSTNQDVYIVGAGSSAASTASLLKNSAIKMNLSNGTITASTFSGDATMANKLDHTVAMEITGGVTGTMGATDFSGSTYAFTVTSVAATAVSGTLSNDTTGNAQTASTATMALQDGAGNVITDTYVTTSQLANALEWKAI